MRNRISHWRRGVAPGAGIRALRLEQLLREELNSIFDGEVGDARLSDVRVSFVELSRDGSRARVWYSMKDNSDSARVKQTHSALLCAASYVRARPSDALSLERTPELSFRHDPSVAALQDPKNG